MNTLAKNLMGAVQRIVGNSIQLKANKSSLVRACGSNNTQGSLLNSSRLCLGNIMQGLEQVRAASSLWQMHRRGSYITKKKNKNPFEGKPFAKGTVLKTVVKKPKKPNSANRKCVIVRLSTGKEMTAYVPGIGHNLQEHNIVLCRVGRLQDTPGVKIKCVRGKFDLPHVVKRTNN